MAFRPMLARSAERLPVAGGWRYEPKWDGFRAAVSPGSITSRNGRDLGRFFPDVLAAAAASLPPDCVLDGEIVAPFGGGVSFERLQSRLAPVHALPRAGAAFIAFDVLELGTDVRGLPLAERRLLLQGLVGTHPAIGLNPQVDDPSEAAGWLSGSVPGIEGVVAKRAGDTYLPGLRRWVKVKRRESIDVVIGGFRSRSALLGLYDAEGLLHHVGSTVALPDYRLTALSIIAPEVERGEAFTGRPPGFGRWHHDRFEDWREVEPLIVAEVSYTQVDGGRFRHAVRLVRVRSDKVPDECAMDDLIG